jgi:hypothetical protein
MESTEFCFWLHGFFELSKSDKLTQTQVKQVKQIKDHLDLVFTKVTPDRDDEYVTLKSGKKAKKIKMKMPFLDMNNLGQTYDPDNTKYCSNSLGSRKIC